MKYLLDIALVTVVVAAMMFIFRVGLDTGRGQCATKEVVTAQDDSLLYVWKPGTYQTLGN